MQYRHYHIVSFEMPGDQWLRARKWLYQRQCLGVESNGPETKRVQVRAYFEEKHRIESLRRSLARAFPEVGSFQSTTIGLTHHLQNNADFKPFPLTGNFWVYPAGPQGKPENKGEKGRIFLTPVSVFGTGRHETTQVVAQLMAVMPVRPASLLDVGSGTGILAILAHCLGIERIDAVEICREARAQARQNFRVNDLPQVGLFGDLKKVSGKYEAVVANLLTPTILHLKRDLRRRLAPGGRLLLSGITLGESDEVREAFPQLRLEKEIQQGEWVGMMFTCPT